MPSRAARIPTLRHHKPSGQAVVTINGRDVYLGPHGTPASRAEYDRMVAESVLNGRGLAAESTSDLSVNELLVAYLSHAESYYRKGGEMTREVANIRDSVRPLRRLYGHTLASQFGPLALKVVRQEMITDGLCRNEVNKRTGRIVRLFKWGVENEMVPPAVHHGLRSVSGLRRGRADVRESEPIKPVPEAFVHAVRPHVSRQVWAMIQLQWLTGMRPGEVCIMRSRDVETSGAVWVYSPESHKTEHHGRVRRIYFGPQAQEVLRPWLRTDLAAPLFSPMEAMAERRAELRKTRQTPMTPSQMKRTPKRKPKRTPREVYSSQTYHHAILRGCERAGVPHWHPNQLRHNAATTLRKEFGLDVARAVLGHSSPAVTEIYAELDGAKAAEAMARVG